ncbi:MAG: Flagellar brake protein YcgR [Calditrichaeota bacterium]|nr:Flagellar brake protein YcgR [Calditrichota bacterium]
MFPHDDPRTLHVGEPITCRTAVEGRVISFDARVRDVDPDGLYVDRPSGIGEALIPGTELLVRYIRSDSAYQFLTIVLEPPRADDGGATDGMDEPRLEIAGNPVLLLRFPARITRFQRREYDRSAVEGVVRYRVGNRDTNAYRGYILDLSAGGVRFATRQPGFLEQGRSPIGRRIFITLLLTKGLELDDVPSEIRRVTLDTAHVDDDYVIVQAAFRELDEKRREKLDTWVRRQQRAGERSSDC